MTFSPVTRAGRTNEGRGKEKDGKDGLERIILPLPSLKHRSLKSVQST